jgi:cytochrome c peroxidase
MRAIIWMSVGWLCLLGAACSVESAPGSTDREGADRAGQSETDEPGIHGAGMNGPGMHGGGMHGSSMQGGQLAMLGKHLFFDRNLSKGRNQSCAACHAGAVGWTGPDREVNAAGGVYEGSVAGRFGNRKPPASAYATLAPVLTLDAERGFVGGNFWDGRATGWKRGSPAADQATGPFLNPVEQALPDERTLADLVCNAHYSMMFRRVWGTKACSDANGVLDKIAFSIAAFEGSSAVSAFSSKYDAFLVGRAQLDAREELGLSLFRGKAHCSNCHTADGGPGRPAAFTDFTFDNLGVPRNPENPFYAMDEVLVDGVPINPLGDAFVDEGLGGFLAQLAASDDWRTDRYVTQPLRTTSSAELHVLAAANRGKQRVPTLRNVDRRPGAGVVKAYTHNAYFKSLESLVHFYNTRDVLPRCAAPATAAQAMAQGCWPAPEVADNVNADELGHLGLTDAEEDALVAFMRTLSDGFRR